MNTTALRFAIGLAALCALTACGGGASVPSTSACLFSGLSQLIYPAPGASNVPDSPGQIVFATSQLFPSSFEVLVATDQNASHPVSGGAAAFQQISSSQVPSPSATVTISNPDYESATVGATFPHGTYYVFLNDSLYSCTPALAGSFTTQ